MERTRVYFDDLSDLISELALADIEKIATILKENPKYKVKVIGHTDPVEEAKATGNISLNRANAVRDALVGFGVNEGQAISCRGSRFRTNHNRRYICRSSSEPTRLCFQWISKNLGPNKQTKKIEPFQPIYREWEGFFYSFTTDVRKE